MATDVTQEMNKKAVAILLLAVGLIILVPLVPAQAEYPTCYCSGPCSCPAIQSVPAVDSVSFLFTGFGSQLYSANGQAFFQFHFTRTEIA